MKAPEFGKLRAFAIGFASGSLSDNRSRSEDIHNRTSDGLTDFPVSAGSEQARWIAVPSNPKSDSGKGGPSCGSVSSKYRRGHSSAETIPETRIGFVRVTKPSPALGVPTIGAFKQLDVGNYRQSTPIVGPNQKSSQGA